MILHAILYGREIGFLPSGKNVNLVCLTKKKRRGEYLDIRKRSYEEN